MGIKPIIDSQDFLDDVAINDIDIDGAFRSQASLFASYAAKHFEAQQQLGNAKILLDLKKARLDKEIRDRLVEEKAKATEATVENEIKRHPTYMSACKDMNEASAIVDLLKNALEAFKQRKDMLISLGANQREEMKGDLRMGIRDGRKAILDETARRMGYVG